MNDRGNEPEQVTETNDSMQACGSASTCCPHHKYANLWRAMIYGPLVLLTTAMAAAAVVPGLAEYASPMLPAGFVPEGYRCPCHEACPAHMTSPGPTDAPDKPTPVDLTITGDEPTRETNAIANSTTAVETASAGEK